MNGFDVIAYMQTPLYMAEVMLGIISLIIFKPWKYFHKK